MNKDFYAVILAGGRGERFWPLSTQSHPKQFLTLFGGKTLIALAVERILDVVSLSNILVVTSQDLVEETRRALIDLPAENIIGEPCARDTAAACALACGIVKARNANGVVAILTADQLIEKEPFGDVLQSAFAAALKHEVIVTIGIAPEYPATGFGYIEKGEIFLNDEKTRIYKAKRFREKPDLETAKSYVESGRFSWNAGMFIWHVGTMEKAIAKFTPSLLSLLKLPQKYPSFSELVEKLGEVYPTLEKISVDFAIMEHADNIVVADGIFNWDDVGTWSAIAKHFSADKSGNVVIGKAVCADANSNIIVSENGHLTALLGCDELIVVHTKSATLVCPKSRAQDLKMLVKKIATTEGGEAFV